MRLVEMRLVGLADPEVTWKLVLEYFWISSLAPKCTYFLHACISL
jgi:hypothetical protein